MAFSFFMYSYTLLSRGFTDPCEIMRGGSTTFRTDLLQLWGIAQEWPSFGRQQGPYGGYASSCCRCVDVTNMPPHYNLSPCEDISPTSSFDDDRSFATAGPRLWNSLPVDIQSAPSLTTFRHKLKTHLFRQSYPDIVL